MGSNEIPGQYTSLPPPTPPPSKDKKIKTDGGRKKTHKTAKTRRHSKRHRRRHMKGGLGPEDVPESAIPMEKNESPPSTDYSGFENLGESTAKTPRETLHEELNRYRAQPPQGREYDKLAKLAKEVAEMDVNEGKKMDPDVLEHIGKQGGEYGLFQVYDDIAKEYVRKYKLEREKVGGRRRKTRRGKKLNGRK